MVIFNIFDTVFLLPLEYIYFFSRKNTDSLWMFFKDVFCSNSSLLVSSCSSQVNVHFFIPPIVSLVS